MPTDASFCALIRNGLTCGEDPAWSLALIQQIEPDFHGTPIAQQRGTGGNISKMRVFGRTAVVVLLIVFGSIFVIQAKTISHSSQQRSSASPSLAAVLNQWNQSYEFAQPGLLVVLGVVLIVSGRRLAGIVNSRAYSRRQRSRLKEKSNLSLKDKRPLSFTAVSRS